MKLVHLKSNKKFQRTIAIVLIAILAVSSARAGLQIIFGNGIAVTGADGILYTSGNGIAVTGADGWLAFAPNGITAPTTSGIAVTGADGYTYTGANGIAVTGADGMNIVQASGIAVTGADGIAVTGADGTTYQANSLLIRNPTGIAVTGADGIAVTGADGVTSPASDALNIVRADGIAVTGADGIAVTGADGIAVTGADGTVYTISPMGIAVTGADGIAVTGADGIAVTGADSINGLLSPVLQQVGLQSLDPELALTLNRLTDDSNVNAAVVYHRLPTDADIADLQRLGILGGTRYRALPVVSLTATKRQLVAVSHLPAVRSIYGNRTLPSLGDIGGNLTGAGRARADVDLTAKNSGLPVSGRGVTVAVLDTGLDGWHGDLLGRVVNNVKLVGTLGLGGGFNYPISLEHLPNTDLLDGHGTFVSGIIAGSGLMSGGKYNGVAPGANLLGVSAGDLNLFFVLEGFDYLLAYGANYGVRVVNCSFSASTVYDPNDPVNVATKMLTDRGISVVFSAGNSGPGMDSMNPYAQAPWVISVGATDSKGRLASYSSRGSFGSSGPSLVAPGTTVISLRTATAPSVTGVLGIESGNDLANLSLTQLPFYTTASGTSFSAPQVAGAIALMLEVNPSLTPAQIRDILQRTATPMPPYFKHEVGAGMLNAQAAVLEAAFPERHMGMYRATLGLNQSRFINDPPRLFSGTVQSSTNISLPVPQNALLASVQIAWGPMVSTNDLALRLTAPGGVSRPEVNTLNLLGLTGQRERDMVTLPASGSWTARVRNTGLLSLLTSPQPFNGAMEVTRVEYPTMQDLGSLSSTSRDEIYQSLRSFLMAPFGRNFRPQFTISRYDLASALMMGGRVPQYLAAQPRFSDVMDALTRLAVESAQYSPTGALFTDVTFGGQFRPDDRATKLVAAIALVRAAGLRAQADTLAGTSLPVTDAGLIPSNLRGYVSVALSQGLLTTDDTAFNPNRAVTRAELAHAMAVVMKLASQ
jgi:serine protease AprX